MFSKAIEFIKNHIDFKFYGVTWIALLVGLSIIPMLLFLPQKYGYENGLIENTQMCVLFITLYYVYHQKLIKSFLTFARLRYL